MDAPADPASSDYPARPEWYFLSLFQMLKLFKGTQEIIGTFVIPTALVVVMMLLPFFDRVLPRRFAHFLACGLVFAVVGGAGYLTTQAMIDDGRDSLFQQGRKNADAARQRASTWPVLPHVGIPPDGASYILPGSAHPGKQRPREAYAWAVMSLAERAPVLRRLPTSRTSARGSGFAGCWKTRVHRRISAR